MITPEAITKALGLALAQVAGSVPTLAGYGGTLVWGA